MPKTETETDELPGGRYIAKITDAWVESGDGEVLVKYRLTVLRGEFEGKLLFKLLNIASRAGVEVCDRDFTRLGFGSSGSHSSVAEVLNSCVGLIVLVEQMYWKEFQDVRFIKLLEEF